MTQYYEYPITLHGNKDYIKPLVEESGWIFSCIDGDIILGEGVKCYATMHYSHTRFELQDIIDKVQWVANSLRRFDIIVLREKVELVIWNTRQKIVSN